MHRKKKGKKRKDERKHHGTVDESSSELQFRKLDTYNYLCCMKNLEPYACLVIVGLTAGRLGVRRNIGNIDLKLNILYRSH